MLNVYVNFGKVRFSRTLDDNTGQEHWIITLGVRKIGIDDNIPLMFT